MIMIIRLSDIRLMMYKNKFGMVGRSRGRRKRGIICDFLEVLGLVY